MYELLNTYSVDDHGLNVFHRFIFDHKIQINEKGYLFHFVLY